MTPQPTQPQLTPITNIEQRLREAVDRAHIEGDVKTAMEGFGWYCYRVGYNDARAEAFAELHRQSIGAVS